MWSTTSGRRQVGGSECFVKCSLATSEHLGQVIDWVEHFRLMVCKDSDQSGEGVSNNVLQATIQAGIQDKSMLATSGGWLLKSKAWRIVSRSHGPFSPQGQRTCTHTSCRTHIFLTHFPCVAYRHRLHAWLKVFAVRMSYLSISLSPFSCFMHRL